MIHVTNSSSIHRLKKNLKAKQNFNSTGTLSPLPFHFIIHSSCTRSPTLLCEYKFFYFFAMAAVLETLTIPRASALPSASLAPVAGSSVSRRSSLRFSEFRGLKIQPARSSASMSSRSRLDRRGSRIVCEAQETAVEGYDFLSLSLFYSKLVFSCCLLYVFCAGWGC